MIPLLPVLFTALVVLHSASSITLSVSTTGGNAPSPLLYGPMFEDINHSGDGGLHGQLLQNNGFQGSNPGLTAYTAIGGTTLSVDTASPLSTAITRSLKVSIPSGKTGQVGFSNSGYEGVPVNTDTYANYFWMKGSYAGTVTVSLVGSASGKVFGSKQVSVNSNSSAFSYYETTFTATQSPDENNEWRLTFDATKVAGGSLWYNGLRNDVATFMEAIGGTFLRFPGGNNLEGQTPDDRWRWDKTVGPVQLRPGRQGDWGYPNTDALGLMEYMQWCEDMKLALVLAVWGSWSLGGTEYTGSALAPYVTEVMNELELLLGDSSTKYGKLRASYGRSNPYSVTMVEIGNEDNLSGGCSTYASRFTSYYNAIHAKYPSITVIASTSDSSCLPNLLPSGVWTDIHHYLEPQQFVSQFNEFDHTPRGSGRGIFVGEYANTRTTSGAQVYWTQMQGSCAETVYMIGLERNSDTVKTASYAPLLEHFNMTQWSPDLFGLYSKPGSTSYYVQKMFAINKGNTIPPVTSDMAFNPVFWVASSAGSGTYYVKLANYGTSPQSVTVKIPNASNNNPATLQILSGGATQSNYPLQVSTTPKTTSVFGSAAGGYAFSLPAWGVAVLKVQ